MMSATLSFIDIAESAPTDPSESPPTNPAPAKSPPANPSLAEYSTDPLHSTASAAPTKTS
jgi:hypothetical protein